MKKETTLDWLWDQWQGEDHSYDSLKLLFELAKMKEKRQIVDAYLNGVSDEHRYQTKGTGRVDGLAYYEETYQAR